MKERRLGTTNLDLTTVGLGTWAIGGPWQVGWGPQDDGIAVDAIIKALELDINWIDTAPIYGCGHSEELVGMALKQTSLKPYIATKCGLLWNDKREKVNCLKKDSIKQECYNSLQRLGIDVIDLYQMHRPVPDEDIEQAWEQMAQLREQGLVRWLGVSNCTVEQMERLRKIHPIHSVQPTYSMLHRDIEADLLPYCIENDIGVIVYSPMQRGLLTGKFSSARLAALAPDDHRRSHTDFQEPRFSKALQLVEQLRPIAEKTGHTCAQLAISWTLYRTGVTAAIVGARSPEQIEETASASDYILSERDMQQIEKILAKLFSDDSAGGTDTAGSTSVADSAGNTDSSGSTGIADRVRDTNRADSTGSADGADRTDSAGSANTENNSNKIGIVEIQDIQDKDGNGKGQNKLYKPAR